MFLPASPAFTPTLALSVWKAHTQFPGNDSVWESLGWNQNGPGGRKACELGSFREPDL